MAWCLVLTPSLGLTLPLTVADAATSAAHGEFIRFVNNQTTSRARWINDRRCDIDLLGATSRHQNDAALRRKHMRYNAELNLAESAMEGINHHFEDWPHYIRPGVCKFSNFRAFSDAYAEAPLPSLCARRSRHESCACQLAREFSKVQLCVCIEPIVYMDLVVLSVCVLAPPSTCCTNCAC